MRRSSRTLSPYLGLQVAAACALLMLAGCGSPSNDEGAKTDPGTSTSAIEAATVDLTGVRFDVRRDPG